MLCLANILVSFFLMSTSVMYADLDSSDLPNCPIWTYPSPPHNECVCGSSLEDIIICKSETLTVQLTVKFFCLTITLFNSKGVTTTLLGTCPYGSSGNTTEECNSLYQ